MIPKTRTQRAHVKARAEHAGGVTIDEARAGALGDPSIGRDRPSRAVLYAAYDFLLGPHPRTEAERNAMDDALDAMAEDMRSNPRA